VIAQYNLVRSNFADSVSSLGYRTGSQDDALQQHRSPTPSIAGNLVFAETIWVLMKCYSFQQLELFLQISISAGDRTILAGMVQAPAS